jgi:PIN domain nuclease of toxin-antitoxin system
MRYLLDTHAFLWMAADPDRLSKKILNIMQKQVNELFLSAAGGWEVALLHMLGRIELPDTPRRFIPEAMNQFNIEPLPITFPTAISAATLPLIHRDPFDRIIIAEAKKENMCIMTKDAMFSRYGVETIW